MSSSTSGGAGSHDTVALVFETEGCVMAAWKNVSIVVWATPATLALSRGLKPFRRT